MATRTSYPEQSALIERYRDWQYRWGLYQNQSLTGLGLTFYLIVWAVGIAFVLPVMLSPFIWLLKPWWWFWTGFVN